MDSFISMMNKSLDSSVSVELVFVLIRVINKLWSCDDLKCLTI